MPEKPSGSGEKPKGIETRAQLSQLLAATLAASPLTADGQEKPTDVLVGNFASQTEQVVEGPQILQFNDADIVAGVDTTGMAYEKVREELGRVRAAAVTKIMDRVNLLFKEGKVELAHKQFAQLMEQTKNPDKKEMWSYTDRAITQILEPLNVIDKTSGKREDTISLEDLKDLSSALIMDMSIGFTDPGRFPNKEVLRQRMNQMKDVLEKWKYPNLDQYDFDNMDQESFNELMFQVGNGTYKLLEKFPERRRSIAGVLTNISNAYSGSSEKEGLSASIKTK